MIRAIQSMTDCSNEQEAQEILKGLEIQQGYLASRILPPAPGKPWRVQAFFEDEEIENSWLPDGLRRVIIPQSMALRFGLSGPDQKLSKAAVKLIKITQAEGDDGEYGRSCSVTTWGQANQCLSSWATTAPKDGSYYKCDFEIIWTNGEVYVGRFDLERKHSRGGDLLGDQVRSMLGFLAGSLKPVWITEEQWEACKMQYKDERGNAIKMLNTLDMNGD